MEQDGATPHYSVSVRNTRLDFFLKYKVFATRSDITKNLKERIRTKMHNISPKVFENIKQEFYYRYGIGGLQPTSTRRTF